MGLFAALNFHFSWPTLDHCGPVYPNILQGKGIQSFQSVWKETARPPISHLKLSSGWNTDSWRWIFGHFLNISQWFSLSDMLKIYLWRSLTAWANAMTASETNISWASNSVFSRVSLSLYQHLSKNGFALLKIYFLSTLSLRIYSRQQI